MEMRRTDVQNPPVKIHFISTKCFLKRNRSQNDSKIDSKKRRMIFLSFYHPGFQNFDIVDYLNFILS